MIGVDASWRQLGIEGKRRARGWPWRFPHLKIEMWGTQIFGDVVGEG